MAREGRQSSFCGKVAFNSAQQREEREREENKYFRWTLEASGGRIRCRLVEIEPVDYPEDEAELLRRHFKSKKERLVTPLSGEVVWLSTIRVGNAAN